MCKSLHKEMRHSFYLFTSLKRHILGIKIIRLTVGGKVYEQNHWISEPVRILGILDQGFSMGTMVPRWGLCGTQWRIFGLLGCLENALWFLGGSRDRRHPAMCGQTCSKKNYIVSCTVLKCFIGSSWKMNYT